MSYLSPFQCSPSVASDGLCMNLLGFDLCAINGLDTGDPLSVVQGFLSQINTALVPLSPIFAIFDVIIAIVECIKAIPDVVGPPPDPTKIISAIAKLIKKLAKVLGMVPTMTVPKMVKQILTVVGTAFLALQREMYAIMAAMDRVATIVTMFGKPGNGGLSNVLNCAQGQIDTRLANLAKSIDPINKILEIVNLLMDIAQMPKDKRPPSFSGFGPAPQETIKILGESATIMLEIASFLPG